MMHKLPLACSRGYVTSTSLNQSLLVRRVYAIHPSQQSCTCIVYIEEGTEGDNLLLQCHSKSHNIAARCCMPT